MFGELVSCVTSDGVKLDGFVAQGSRANGKCWLVTHGVNDSFYGSPLLRTMVSELANHAEHVLLVNNRGHNISTVNFGAVPMRLGSQYETVAKCVLDFEAWGQFIASRGKRWGGLAAHSLGAVKSVFWLYGGGLAAVDREKNSYLESLPTELLLLSPPRLTTELLANDPRRGAAFSADLETAKKLCEDGRSDHIMRIRYPMPNWVSAATFLDKYGSSDRYDYLKLLPQARNLQLPIERALWLFGEREVRAGSANFFNADLNLGHLLQDVGMEHHQVRVIDGADHAYRASELELCRVIDDWQMGRC